MTRAFASGIGFESVRASVSKAPQVIVRTSFTSVTWLPPRPERVALGVMITRA